MIDFSKHRWLIVTAVHYATLFFVSQINHYLVPVGLHLFVAGMLISFSVMELNFRQGFLSIIPVALHLDSKSPLPFGFALIIFLCLYTLAHFARSRVRREASSSTLVSSILLNLAAFLAYTIGTAVYLSGDGLNFLVLAMNLSVSALVILMINRLFFDVQYGVLSLFGINLAEEQRQAR